MTRSDYFSLPGVNWSRLKCMRDSPMAYRHAVDVGMEDSDTLREGRLLHTIVLEPQRLLDEYAIWHGKVRNGKAWDAFEAENTDRCIVTSGQMEMAQAMARAVLMSAEARYYIGARGVQFEQSMQWVDAATGLACKARADILLPGRRTVADLKSAASIDARRFGNQAARLGYHCQAAHYGNGVAASKGWAPEQYKLIVVEKVPPHDVAVFDIGSEELEIGRDEVAQLLGRVRECTAADSWPGRYAGEQALQLPAYIHGEVEFEHE